MGLVVGCGFTPGDQGDAPLAGDAGRADAPPAGSDARSSDASGGRTTAGLIALWTFDDGSGSDAHDTAQSFGAAGSAVDLVVTRGSAAWAPGTLALTTPSVLASKVSHPHLNSDCKAAGACTLELWVEPATADEHAGSDDEPVVVAGMSANLASRNFSILQQGTAWVGRARTGSDANGGPDLTPAAPVTPALTHLVLVVSATTRALYVNGVEVASTAPGSLATWDTTYPMVIGSELQQTRAWLGTYALAALYDRALTPAEIAANYAAGPAL